jgi:uncharacterized membrane protein
MNRQATSGERSCQVCGATRRAVLRRALVVRPAVAQLIERETGRWDESGWICLDDLTRYQHRYVHSLLEAERGELTALDREVLDALREHEILARNPETEFESGLTLGQRLADRLATFGGSWTFITAFGVLLVGWMAVNSIALIARPFDPFPYILLNLVLSALAALQAPVIMMSQNRQEARDRQRAIHDYRVDLKAELEIRQLHQKLDHLLSRQWERLIEIQEIQLELIDEIRRRR